jgi:hypothetical protein
MKRTSLWRHIGMAALVLGSFLFVLIPSLHFRGNAQGAVDFKTVYGSSRCLLEHCNPYDSKDAEQAYIRGGGDSSTSSAFWPYQVLYPPQSLFWVMPFASLPWIFAISIWVAVTAALFLTAAFLMADLCDRGSILSMILLGAFTATSTLLLVSANPAGLAIGLCVIAVWCLIKDNYPNIGIFCFALSLSLKPQLGGLILIYFLLAGRAFRKRALQIIGATVLLSVPGIVWVSVMPQSAHWPHDLAANLTGTQSRGNPNDPGPTNPYSTQISDLQSVVSVFRDDPPFYNHVSWAIVGSLILIWAIVAVRASPSHRKDLLGIATIACLCLLPSYHRNHDLRLLLLTFPAVALLMEEGGLAGILAATASIAAIAFSHPHFFGGHFVNHNGPVSRLQTVALLRPSPLMLLASGLFYLACFTKTLRTTTLRKQDGVVGSVDAVSARFSLNLGPR